MNAHINYLLADFGNALGLEGLSLDESGHCCLSFDDIVVSIESVGDSSLVLLYSGLGILPADAGREVYIRLLEANYFFHGTAGATIGLDASSREAVITRVLDAAGMKVLDWEAALKGFIDAAENCKALLQARADNAPSSPDRDLSPTNRNHFIRG